MQAPEEGLYDWNVLAGEPGTASPTTVRDEDAARRPSGLRAMLQNTKARLYNMYQRSGGGGDTLSSLRHADVWLLGQVYRGPAPAAEEAAAPVQGEAEAAALAEDVRSRLWFTYRNDLARPLDGPAQLTTDMGWGCMVRTAQMMLAHALILHFLGRDWRLGPMLATPGAPAHKLATFTYNQLLRWFLDSPQPTSPYSLHRVARLAARRYGYRAGELLGPTLVCRVFERLVLQHSPDGLAMYVPPDGVLYLDRVHALCASPLQPASHAPSAPGPGAGAGQAQGQGQGAAWRPLIIWVPLRLGVARLNPLYVPALQRFLQWPQTLGFIGGKPNSSYFFFGYQDDKVLFLDPHLVQPALRDGPDSLFPPSSSSLPSSSTPPDRPFYSFSAPPPRYETYHCAAAKRMSWDDLDPSLAVGFFCRDRRDLAALAEHIRALEAGAAPLGVEATCPEHLADEAADDEPSEAAPPAAPTFPDTPRGPLKTSR